MDNTFILVFTVQRALKTLFWFLKFFLFLSRFNPECLRRRDKVIIKEREERKCSSSHILAIKKYIYNLKVNWLI
jgi:hypothetical protein